MARRQAGRSARARIVGTLDIGSSKIACLVTEVTGASGSGDLTIRVLGSGIQRSQGVKAGVIVDPDKVETAVRAAVTAEVAMLRRRPDTPSRLPGVAAPAAPISAKIGRAHV